VSAVVLFDYRPAWPLEFEHIAEQLRGGVVLRVDHTGSTSVPGLVAKDVVDLQAIVERLDVEQLVQQFAAVRFELNPEPLTRRDHVPVGWGGPAAAWDKLLFQPATGRPVNAHVRVAHSPNERYALLFRDYLCANDDARDAWADVKRRLASTAVSRDAYTETKDPLTDQLMADAEAWAKATGWSVH
jgi:dephospho-CoA kinase